jgi:hypothetical protein
MVLQSVVGGSIFLGKEKLSLKIIFAEKFEYFRLNFKYLMKLVDGSE